MDDLSVDVLSYLLAFTQTNETRTIMLVCKKWLDASRKSIFWRGRIVRKLREHAGTDFMKLYKDFNPFIFHEVDLFHKLGWIFKTFKSDKSKNVLFLWLHLTGSMLFTFNKNSVHKHVITLNLSDNSYSGIHKYNRTNGLIELRVYKKDITSEVVIESIVCRYTNGTLYVGQALGNNQKINPHGGGKWTFLSGKTFEGENVAFDGLPHGKGLDENGQRVVYFAGVEINKKLKLG